MFLNWYRHFWRLVDDYVGANGYESVGRLGL
jgi:hypothetical protein